MTRNRTRLIAGLCLNAFALTAPGAPVWAQAPAARSASSPQPAQLDRNDVLILIRSVLLALDDANKTGNYTVLRDLGAPGFQAANNAAQLGDIFAKQRNENLDLSGVAVLEPQLTLLPEIQNGYLRMAGFFPSVPLQVNFELLFAPVGGRWRLFGLAVNVGPGAPVAPALSVQTNEPAPSKKRGPKKPYGTAKLSKHHGASDDLKPKPP